jgi:hypothetical protein
MENCQASAQVTAKAQHQPITIPQFIEGPVHLTRDIDTKETGQNRHFDVTDISCHSRGKHGLWFREWLLLGSWSGDRDGQFDIRSVAPDKDRCGGTHREHRLRWRGAIGAVKAEQDVTRSKSCLRRRSALMNVSDDPMVGIGWIAHAGGADRQPGRNPAHGLVKESGVARAKQPNHVMHCCLKALWFCFADDSLAIVSDEAVPVHSSETRVEVKLADLPASLIVNAGSLLSCQSWWRRS